MAKLSTSFPALKLPVGTEFINAILTYFRQVAGAVNQPDFGTTAARPVAQLVMGQTYFDVTLGKPIWWRGVWVDASGVPV